jgi:putative phosphoribosyl transferase
VTEKEPNKLLHYERPVSIPSNGVVLSGSLVVPDDAAGIVLFAHGSGSSRLSPRNRFVARELEARGLATLLLDLLTAEEEVQDQSAGQFRFDIRLLAARLGAVARWVAGIDEVRSLPMGYFGASTGAAAALLAAAQDPERVGAIVSRGGRPDLAGQALIHVHAPTLLLVGGNDEAVLGLNRQALARLGSAEKHLVVVPGASHLFSEPGTLEEVARQAGDWFLRWLGAGKPLRAAALAG